LRSAWPSELASLRQALSAPIDRPLPLLTWWGLEEATAGALLREARAMAASDFAEVPAAHWDLAHDRLEPDRALLGIARGYLDWSRAQRGRSFAFRRFELVLALLHYRLGEAVSTVSAADARLKLLTQAVASLVPLPLVGGVVEAGLRKVTSGLVDLVPGVRRFLEEAAGDEYVTRLRGMDVGDLVAELLPALTSDFEDALPPRERHAARALLTLSGYDRLRRPAHDPGYELWVRIGLLPALHHAGVLVVACALEPIPWSEDALRDLHIEAGRAAGNG
jgi:hypothetical protein